MIHLETKAFGAIDINPLQIINFPDGIYGFRDTREFALIDDKEGSPFKWLQSTEDPDLAFILIQPELFMRDIYEPLIGDKEMESLEVKEINECLIFL